MQPPLTLSSSAACANGAAPLPATSTSARSAAAADHPLAAAARARIRQPLELEGMRCVLPVELLSLDVHVTLLQERAADSRRTQPGAAFGGARASAPRTTR
jgi:hypothetical protein